MVQGDAYSVEVSICNQDQPLNIEQVSLVEISLGSFVKVYPGEITYTAGAFRFPVTQEETFRLPSRCPM